MGTFSSIATELTIEFFYDVYGIPAGCQYIAGTSQTWEIAAVFQVLAILGFFASSIILLANLGKTKVVSELGVYSRDIKNNVVVDKMVKNENVPTELPSIKSWKEYVPFLVTFIPLILFPFFTYYPCYDAAARLFGSSYSLPNVNGIALFTFVNGLFSCFMLFVNWGVRRLCHLKDGVKVESPFVYAKLSGFTQFLKILVFSVFIVLLMYVPCYFAYKWSSMNFELSVYTVGLPRVEWIPTMLFKYLPFWLVFMIPNCLLNAGCRYKEIPEWGSTLFIVLANLLAIVLLIAINYTTLVTTGQTQFTFGDPSIMIWNLLAPMVFVALVGRYYYKKTGNIWTGVLVCALVLTCMATTITRHTSSEMFSF